MKFIIDKENFLKTLQRIQGIVEKRNTMPILANVLLEAKDGRINTMATDLEVFIKDSTGADVSEEGSLTVNARKLFEIAKELPDEKIKVSSGEADKIVVTGGKARFNIMGLPSKDFPIFPAYEESALQTIEKENLKEMVDKTAFAVSTDETRYNINGFLLEKDEGKLRMVATDGHRLALIEKPDGAGIQAGDKKGVLMPRKGVMEMRKLLEEKEGEFQLGVTEKNAVMKKDHTVINTRLLEGEFPDYDKVIPKDNNEEVTAVRTSLLASLKRVSILSMDRIKGVRFNFSPGSLVLTSSSPDIGEATEELDIEYSGQTVEIAFNARYFIDMLEATEDETVTIRLKDPTSPAIVNPRGSEEYTYIIMPMRL
ncbi:MAG: DNA polymerase III subunit beta [Thermodesulfobacteriota bacterium]